MIYDNIVSALSRADTPVRELHGRGCVAVVPAAGRIVAMAFTPNDPNIFWSHPELGNWELVKNHSDQLIGNLGGDRLWFAPELDYFWDGVPDWHNSSNYHVPPQADPGSYHFIDAQPDVISLRSLVQLQVRATGRVVSFEVGRTIRMTPSPIPLDGSNLGNVQYVGVQSSHMIKFASTTMSGRIDLWHLLQVPVGSLLILPLKSSATSSDKAPLLYTGHGGWIERSDCLLWHYGGTACTKFGMSSSALTGRCGILRPLTPWHLCLIVRQFAVDPLASYGDHPHNIPRTDQVFQLWDGLGFGEMEYHSRMLDAQQGPRALQESDYLWAFAGSPDLIHMLAQRLLGIESLSLPMNSR